MSRQATEWRRRVVNALCRLESAAPTIEETDEYAFARRMVNALYDRWREPYVVACYYTFGCHPAKLQERLEARRALRQWELYRLVPDYGPQEDNRVRFGVFNMAAPIKSRLDPGQASREAQNNQTNDRKLGDRRENANPQKPAKTVSWPKRTAVRTVSGRRSAG